MGRGSRVAKENDRGAIQTPRVAQNKKNFLKKVLTTE
jgi:hypothetical protein